MAGGCNTPSVRYPRSPCLSVWGRVPEMLEVDVSLALRAVLGPRWDRGSTLAGI